MDIFDKFKTAFGGQTGLARVLGINSQAVSNWKMRQSIPSGHYRAIVEASGGRISLTDLYQYEENKPR